MCLEQCVGNSDGSVGNWDEGFVFVSGELGFWDFLVLFRGFEKMRAFTEHMVICVLLLTPRWLTCLWPDKLCSRTLTKVSRWRGNRPIRARRPVKTATLDRAGELGF